MSAGDTGATKSEFMGQKDSFARREAAHEAMYIRQVEMEKLENLKRKVEEQRKHMNELDKHMWGYPEFSHSRPTLTGHSDEYTRSQGGEQN
ncbi:ATPase inhibitor, IATP, mitochondria [Penicillium roqueforti FM164]|uniref:ATPase inhibitor, mitochondrial n=1 Tax=Penicillium roqueforti (strain FM164) TaxID=1365484 RepID=W6PR09_PENRF|nr:ATPase inhibitor, IATP, mitochondria [Penicillium roqueforti FM164]